MGNHLRLLGSTVEFYDASPTTPWNVCCEINERGSFFCCGNLKKHEATSSRTRESSVLENRDCLAGAGYGSAPSEPSAELGKPQTFWQAWSHNGTQLCQLPSLKGPNLVWICCFFLYSENLLNEWVRTFTKQKSSDQSFIGIILAATWVYTHWVLVLKNMSVTYDLRQ